VLVYVCGGFVTYYMFECVNRHTDCTLRCYARGCTKYEY